MTTHWHELPANQKNGPGISEPEKLVLPFARAADVSPRDAVEYIVTNGASGIGNAKKAKAFMAAVGNNINWLPLKMAELTGQELTLDAV